MSEKKEQKPRAGLVALMGKKEKEITVSKEETALEYCFWSPIMGEIDGEQYVKDVFIRILPFYRYLYSQGFRSLVYGEQVMFIKIINSRIIKSVKPEVEMMHCIQDFIESLPKKVFTGGHEFHRDMIESKFTQTVNSLFNEMKLKTLRPKEAIIFNQDTRISKFMYFNNGYIQISAKEGIQFKDYKHLQGYIWDSEILKHDYNKVKPDEKKDYIRRFCFNISGGDPKRFEVLKNNIGYYMHSFMDYKCKALLLTDSKISEDGEANGRTGKGLLAEVIGGTISNDPQNSTIKSFVNMPAKDFDINNKHKYASATLETKLIVLNDVRRNFKIEDVYNDITEGITVDRKGEHAYKVRAKMIIIANKAVEIEGDSSIDRVVEFELADYYNARFSPLDEFGHYLFKQWEEEDFCRYYYFMATCSLHFFKNGGKLIQPEQINLNARKLIDSTDRDFIDFVENDWKPVFDERYEKVLIYKKFLEQFEDFQKKNWFSQAKFTAWVKKYINLKGIYELYDVKKNDVRDSATGKRYYVFLKKKTVTN